MALYTYRSEDEYKSEFLRVGYINPSTLQLLLRLISNNKITNICFTSIFDGDTEIHICVVQGDINTHFFTTLVQKEILENHFSNTNNIYNNQMTEENNNISSSISDEDMQYLDQIVTQVHQEIPVNSNTILIDESTSRFSSAIWYENIQSKTIVVAGIGGIGSWVTMLLSRVKPKALFLYDDDIVETGNLSGQFYGDSHVGQYKVDAINYTIQNYSLYNSVFSIREKFTSTSEGADIMICGFDNMQARKDYFKAWKNHVLNKPKEERKECLFIDGRLAVEMFQVLCIQGDDDYNMTRYENEFLFNDSEVEETLCSLKQTSFCANMIASYIVNLFVNFCANQCNPLIPRDVPFFSYYNAEYIQLSTES